MAEEPQFVAVPIPIWHAALELLRKELPMEKAENVVSALRRCQVLGQPVAATPPPSPGTGGPGPPED